MNTFVQTLEYFVFITFELVALFLLISAAVEIILMYIPETKIRSKLSGRGIVGNIMAAGFGALTPFCACSTIPMTVGFLHAGVPFGATMSFLIASPLLNPIIIGMLGAMVGAKAMIAYFVIAFGASVACGFILEKTGMQRYVKNVRLKMHVRQAKTVGRGRSDANSARRFTVRGTACVRLWATCSSA